MAEQTRYIYFYEWSNRREPLPGVLPAAAPELFGAADDYDQIDGAIDRMALSPEGRRVLVPFGLFSDALWAPSSLSQGDKQAFYLNIFENGISTEPYIEFFTRFCDACRARGVAPELIMGDVEGSVGPWSPLWSDAFPVQDQATQWAERADVLREIAGYPLFQRHAHPDLVELFLSGRAGELSIFTDEGRRYWTLFTHAADSYLLEAFRKVFKSRGVFLKPGANLRTKVTNWEWLPKGAVIYDSNYWFRFTGNLDNVASPVAYITGTGAIFQGYIGPMEKHPLWNNMIHLINNVRQCQRLGADTRPWIADDEYAGDHVGYLWKQRALSRELWRHLIRTGVKVFQYWSAHYPERPGGSLDYDSTLYTQPAAERASEFLLSEDRNWPRAYLPDIPYDADEIETRGYVTRYEDMLPYMEGR